jgi:hypothetical protein
MMNPRAADLFASAVSIGGAIGRISLGLAGMDTARRLRCYGD